MDRYAANNLYAACSCSICNFHREEHACHFIQAGFYCERKLRFENVYN